jgi:transposase
MMVFREVLRWHFEVGKSYALIAEYCGLSKGGVHNILQRFAASGLTWPLPEDLDEFALKRRLYPTATPDGDAEVDLGYLRKECTRAGVTRQLLWEEYRAVHPVGMSRSAFYRLCQVAELTKAVMKNDYQGGEYLLVDYSGKRLAFLDRETGEQVPVEIFVASWGASSGTYVEATLTQSAQDFVYAHVRAFAYFGCLPRVVTPDNLKAAVTKPHRANPTLCQLYRKFAEYYDLTILPARVAHPRDKDNASYYTPFTGFNETLVLAASLQCWTWCRSLQAPEWYFAICSRLPASLRSMRGALDPNIGLKRNVTLQLAHAVA